MSVILSSLLLIGASPALPAGAGTIEPDRRVQMVAPVPQRLAQVRIEQRVIIRVPRQVPLRRSLSDVHVRPPREAPRYKEKKIGKCLWMNRIVGVLPAEERSLDFVTQDRQRIRGELEKGCLAREYYSGFYVEKSKDGKLCADRDVLEARSGAKCEVERFRLLVPE